jgi:anti-sigma factor RsiW
MISAIKTMLTCRWAARHIHSYLDADPSAPLAPQEVRRLEAHLATCQRCAAAAEDFRQVQWALARWSECRVVDPASVSRVRAVAAQLLADDWDEQPCGGDR